jgi:hypothetical protein
MATRYVATDGDSTDTQGTYDAAVDLANACSLQVALKYSVAGDVVNVKNGTKAGDTASYVITTVLSPLHNGSTSGPIIFAGYHTTPGDHDGTRPIITTATNSTTLIWVGTYGGGWIWDNITFSSTASTKSYGVLAHTANIELPILFTRCVFDGFSVGILGDYAVDYGMDDLLMDRCEVKNCTSHGIRVQGGLISNCYIHDNAGSGIFAATYNSTVARMPSVYNSVIYSNGVGITLPSNTSNTSFSLLNSAIVSNTGDGIVGVTGIGTRVSLMNSIIYGNGGYGLRSYQTACLVNAVNCAWAVNSSGNTLNVTLDSSNITSALTGDPFVNKAAGNFALNNTSGAGAVLRSAGLCASWPGSATSGFPDIGAVQHAEPTLPAVANVWHGIQFGDGGTELTGTKIAGSIPTNSGTLEAADIITGITVDPGASPGEIVGSASGGNVIVIED